ncbi:MAG: carbohydrate ABC transporter permease [Actinomycetia bacterium]|nr:carbohydrate ABC transporter permease [Actinomycetes bacterium]
MWAMAILWLVPTMGLAINSFRPRDAQRNSGWWTFQADNTGTRVTLDNYESVLSASATNTLTDSLLNSAAIAIPATIIPIAVAAFAAYGFAWIEFRGRRILFISVISLLAIPLQVALIPLLKMYSEGAHLTLPWLDKTLTLVPAWALNGQSMAVWLTHTGFAMPFAIFLLHNYIVSLPKDIFESARIDGADHFTIFWRLVLPLSIPVLAAFAIFQFLWTWNDYLIAVTMLGAAGSENLPTTVAIANLAGDFGRNEHLLTAGAFVQAFIPLLVFFSLQRFFVRGLLAGSVKG